MAEKYKMQRGGSQKQTARHNKEKNSFEKRERGTH